VLPANLLQAIAEPAGGRVVLVIGAGCSFEPPTGLPLSRQCAEQAHAELLANGILVIGDCPDPSDISALADTVVRKTGNQDALVGSMHPGRFKTAQPNQGHTLAAILLIERAVSCVVTLNFDLALSAALQMVGGSDVEIIQGPEDHGQLGAINLVYLHRNANSSPDAWILTTDALDNAWRGQWAEVIGRRFISGPVTVFVGLGSPAGVLLYSVSRLLAAVPARAARVYLVDPGLPEHSKFFEALGLPSPSYIQAGWSAFMQELADRVLDSHLQVLDTACNSLVNTHGLPAEDLAPVWATLRALGLEGLGRLRARWTLSEGAYLPSYAVSADLIADLLLAAACLERLLHARAKFESEGIVEFRDGTHIAGVIVLASGRGVYRWAKLDGELRHKLPRLQRRDLPPRCAIISGVLGGRAITPPENIILEDKPEDIVTGPSWFGMFSADELRQKPDEVRKRIA
jgi:hypothetical protein